MTGAVAGGRFPAPAGRVHSDAVLAAGAIAVCVAVALTPAAAQAGPVLCPFRLATGLPCPACGSVRAWVHAGEGDIPAALAANPFAVGGFAVVLGLLAWRALAALRPAVPPPDVGRLFTSPVALVVVAAWCAWGVARIVA